MIIKDTVMFGRKRNGKYPHAITLSQEHEEKVAIIMEYEHRELSNAIERCIDIKYSKLPNDKRDEAWLRIKERKEKCCT